MDVQTRTAAALTVPACVLVAVAGLLVLKGAYDWSGQPARVAERPLQHDRVVVYAAAAGMAAGALLLLLGGERGPALAVLATVLVPVLLVAPGLAGGTVAFLPCLITVPVAVAMALRAVLAPKTPVTLLAVLVFAVVAVAGSILLVAVSEAVPFMSSFSEEEAHRQASARLVAGLAGVALAAAPVLLLVAGHKAGAALTAPFVLAALITVVDTQTASPWLLYAVAGPPALGASVHVLFTDR
ncbi:hypothetical protein HUT06_23405 [Actinomadura sp. NAK00032]|uniref:hypothetical protein n=1 Tax=Actinomadura sp. NAK00032 TaxID=2742128 RepID=UPI001590B620|nr:hypothetical protein [Actinomadura sp. NAK00032]QKW36604.1 hypothetical protein HUT06_23405 [Actinomadura sp. NAK00032]